jgi:hypothetical protein
MGVLPLPFRQSWNFAIINDAKWAFYSRGENEEMRAVFRQGTSVQQSMSGSNHYRLPSRQATIRRNGAIALDMILNRLQTATDVKTEGIML